MGFFNGGAMRAQERARDLEKLRKERLRVEGDANLAKLQRQEKARIKAAKQELRRDTTLGRARELMSKAQAQRRMQVLGAVKGAKARKVKMSKAKPVEPQGNIFTRQVGDEGTPDFLK